MRTLFILLLSGLLASCTSQRFVHYTVQTEPRYPITPTPQKILVLNTYDPTTATHRKNIEQLNTELIDLVVQRLASVISRRMEVPAESLSGITPLSSGKSRFDSLLEKHQASHVIVVTHFDVSFEQTDVEVTKTTSGKSREAFYDICNTINFELYDRKTLLDKSSYPICKHHSSRQVVSGLLAAGPSYKANQADFVKLSYENSQVFLRRYFPGEEDVTRPIFVGKVFLEMENYLSQKDYDGAIAVNQRIAESAKPRIAAMALYNCAVFSEMKNDFKGAFRFLDQSLNKMYLPQGSDMFSQMNGRPD